MVFPISAKIKDMGAAFLRQRGYDAVPKGRFLTVFLDLHNSCNLRCRMCHFGFRGDKPKDPYFMGLGDFKRLAGNVFAHTSELALSPCTEPMFHNDFLGLLKVVGQYGIPNFWLMTNASLLTEDIARELIRMKASRLLISLDSHKKEVYEGIKVGSDFERVVNNIKMLDRLKKESGVGYPEINFNCLLMRSNVEHVEEYLEFVKNIGGTKVGFFHVIVFKDALQMRGESLFHHKELANRYLEKIPKKAAELGIEIERLPEKFTVGRTALQREQAAQKCRYPWYMAVVDCRGNLRPCEFWFGQEPFGNLVTTSCAKIWNNGKYRQLRKDLLGGALRRPCCAHCVSMSSLGGRSDDEKAFIEIEG